MISRSHRPLQVLAGLSIVLFLGPFFGVAPSVAQPGVQAPPPLPVSAGPLFPLKLDAYDPATGIYDANYAPEFAALADGGYAAVWNRFTTQTDVVVQRFGDDDQPAGPLTQVNQTRSTGEPTTAVAPDGSGFVVAWPGYGAPYSGLFVRRFDSQGDPIGPEHELDAGLGGFQSPDVALSASGGLAVWNGGPDYEGYRVFGRLLDEDGVPVGYPFRLQSSPALFVDQPAVAADGAGGFLVVWRQKEIGQAGGTLFLRRVDGDGNLVEDASIVFHSDDRLPTSPAIGAAPNGTFFVAWNDCPDFGMPVSCGVRMQAFDAEADRRGGPRVLASWEERHSRAPSVSVDADGNHAVTWPWCRGDDSLNPDCGLDTVYFGPQGQKLGVLRPDVAPGAIPSQSSNAEVHGDFLTGWTGIGGAPEGAYAERHRLVERGRGRR